MTRDCILIVEADVAVRHPLAQFLRECGYRVFEAADTDEATTILAADDLEVDVVVAAADSPGRLGGFGLSRWIRANDLGSKVILVGTVERAAKAAGDLCAEGPSRSMPYHHQSLHGQIKRLLAERARAAS